MYEYLWISQDNTAYMWISVKICDGWLASNGLSLFVYFFPNSWESFAKILVKPEILSPIIAKSGFLANGECLARALQDGGDRTRARRCFGCRKLHRMFKGSFAAEWFDK